MCICLMRTYLCQLIFLLFSVTAQEGPGIVIAHPGQDVELLCNIAPSDPSTQRAAWIIDNMGPYNTQVLRNGYVDGYSTNLFSNNLIVKDIIMNDARNNSDFTCVVVLRDNETAIVGRSDLTILYIAGECKYVLMYSCFKWL